MLITKDRIDLDELKNYAFYNKETYFIWHLMLDFKYQGKGYGLQALDQLEAFLKTVDASKIESIVLFYNKDNEVAQRLYKNQGYIDTGFESGSSMLALKEIKKDR